MTAALRQAYDRAADRYGRRRNSRFDEFLMPILDHLACRPGTKPLLDLGCGPGRESAVLAAHGRSCVAADFSIEMARQAHRRGVPTVIADLCDLPFRDASASGVLCSFSLLHLPKHQLPSVLDGIRRVLETAGTLLILTFEGEGELCQLRDLANFGMARPFAFYSLDELRGLVTASGFEVDRTWRLDISPRPSIAIAATKPADSAAA